MGADELATNAATQADNFVSERFVEAQTYAANAWSAANSYLSQMLTTAAHPNIDTNVSIPYTLDAAEIDAVFSGAKPTRPVIDTTLTLNKPSCGLLRELPAFDYLTGQIDALRADLLTKVTSLLTSGTTGLPTDVEQAIYDRAVARKDLDNLALYTEAEQYFSARGFSLPPGALAGRLQEIAIAIARNTVDINRDVMVKQAELEQSNIQFVLKEGISAVTSMMEASINAVINENKGTIDRFQAEIDGYKQEIMSWITGIEAQTKVYIAEMQGYAAEAQVDASKISAQVEVAKVSLEQVRMETDLKLKEAQLTLEESLKVLTLQIEAMRAGSQVTAQIVASALSAVNASASYGFSGGASLSSGQSVTHYYDKTKGEASGEQTIHQYNHSAE